MQFQKDKVYKVIEFDMGLLITGENEKLMNRSSKPLMLGTGDRVLAYLNRYMWEREQGRALRDAHDLALKEAQITDIVKQEFPAIKLS